MIPPDGQWHPIRLSWTVWKDLPTDARMFRKLFLLLRTSFRQRRYQHFWRNTGKYENDGLWLDLGGGPGSYFLAEFSRTQRVILLDLDHSLLQRARAISPNIQCVVADGENLPFRDGAFACIFCNSVIEHVQNPEALARNIQRAGLHFFVQTPNGDFPLETHSAIPIPFFQLMPVKMKRLICKRLGASFDYVSSVTYVSEADLRRFFPSASVEHERFLGMVKSFYIVGTGSYGRKS